MPLTVYAGKRMVGFAMYAKDDPDDGNHWVYRLMVDRRYQKRGYGRAAMQLVLRRIRREYQGPITVSWDPGNRVAAALYVSLGFRLTGKRIGGEIAAILAPTRIR